MNYELTQHARDVLQERQIPIAWLERVLTCPRLIEPSTTDATLESRFSTISEHGDRVLRAWW